MADKLKFCHICFQNNISKPSSVWCSECGQMFCPECEAFHSSLRSSKCHVTTPIETFFVLDESIRQIRTHCVSHDDKYVMFCKTHDVPLCQSCLEEYVDCKGVTPITNVVENVKLSSTANDIEESIRDIEKNVCKIKTYLEKNQETLDQRMNEILSAISQTRKAINEHLDKLENRFKEEVTDITIKTKNQVDSLLRLIYDINDKTLSYQNQFDVLKKHCSDLQTFLVLKQISSNIDSLVKDFRPLMENHSFDQLLLECDINDKLRRLSSDIEKFGEVRLQKTPCDITLDNYKERQAQDVVCMSKSLDSIKIRNVRSFEIAAERVLGCDITLDGTIILTDRYEKCLIGTDSTGKQLFSISTSPDRAFDVTVIDDTTVAVTSGGYKVIIVDISSHTIKRTISVDYFCFGVTHRDGTLFVCAEHRGILSVNLTNDKITTIIQCDLPDFSYITSYKDKLYYTDQKLGTVTCCDIKGNTIWAFKDHSVMRYPRGITTDNTGRVYVCVNHSVIVLSDDGKQSKTIISKDDGLNHPYALYYDKKRNNLLVTNKAKTAFLFHVSS